MDSFDSLYIKASSSQSPLLSGGYCDMLLFVLSYILSVSAMQKISNALKGKHLVCRNKDIKTIKQ